MVQVVADPIEEAGHKLDLADDGVAAAAQQTTHQAGVMAVVNDQEASVGAAQEAAPVLLGLHLVDLFGGKPVLPGQASSQILGLCGLRILAPPLTQPLVAPLSVALTVGTIPLADAGPALPTPPTVLGEGIGGLLDFADSTEHVYSVARLRGIAFDQPCHADVLLELANGGRVVMARVLGYGGSPTNGGAR